MTETPAPAPVLNALSIVVADMAAAIDFYSLCGLEFAEGSADAPHAETSVGAMKIMFDTHAVVESFSPGWTVPTGGQRMALAFECPTTESVDATHDALVRAGYRSHLEPFDAVWGQRYAVVLDPDDNSVDFYCPTGPDTTPN